MAFDQGTRNRLQRLVSDCRKRLTEEFTLQLRQDYGLDPRTGEVTELSRLTHLTDRERHTAALLREMLAHYLSSALAGEKESKAQRQAAIDRIIREQAFTVLNRLAALLMMEARGLLRESVSKGSQSQAFELYRHLAGTSLGETGEAYQTFLFSLFDEFAIDLPALFDRFAPQGRLFPRETALNALLELLNDHEIEPLWALDETIGWIYQYFNSQEERKAMRKASQAPRNSRELAVRNQFFTPRYVVEFLVDNTLGRQWFNATGGTTPLRDSCQYLLVKPDEQPEAGIKLRDPRTLKLLDPACGSMHFGLYAFDLFLQIYRDAWQWEQQHGPGSLDLSTQPEAGFEPLCYTYADEEALLRDVPRLVIEYNIYGVDIDPRAAQIASLALWLRAQRAWHEAGVPALERPDVGQGNVIAAVAPPAEKELREAFAARLDAQDAELFEKTLHMLKGLPELGVLLRAEKELPALIRQVYVGKGTGLFAEQEQETWQKAEERLRRALLDFSEQASATYQSRLFAQDALQGLRMIDLCRVVFDVVVMNPPFGDVTSSTKKYLENTYPRSKGNILAHFVERANEVVRPSGFVSAIVSRTCFYLKSFSYFREDFLRKNLALKCFADLGQGVLDAMVETAAVCWEKKAEGHRDSVFFRELASEKKGDGLYESVLNFRRSLKNNRMFISSVESFSVLDDSPYVYWVSQSVLKKIADRDHIEPEHASIRVGLQTGDDFRFLRAWWEVSHDQILIPSKEKNLDEVQRQAVDLSKNKKWAWYSKTESASPVLSSIHLLVNWFGNGAEIKANHVGKGHSASKYVMSESMYFRPGFSYMLRSSRLVPYIVPMGVIPTAGRSQVYPKEGSETWLAALLLSNLATAVARFRGEAFWQPKFQNSMVSVVPYVKPQTSSLSEAYRVISEIRERMSEKFKRDETEIQFTPSSLDREAKGSQPFNRKTLAGEVFDEHVAELCGLTSEEFHALQRDHNEALVRVSGVINGEADEGQREGSNAEFDEIVDKAFLHHSWAIGVSFGRFDWRLVIGEREVPPEPEPFDPLPAKSPGMLPDGAEPYHRHAGILVDDPGHEHDLPRLMSDVLETVDAQVDEDLRRWLRRDFFKYHLQQYSKSRRKAPIYWPLATASGSYTLWLYYPDLTDQTLFTAVNDFVEPKLKQVDSELGNLRLAGASRSRADEKRLEELSDFRDELADLRDALLKIAPGYKPNHDDGVQITAAPLWPLFRHKPWQKVLKETWEKLEQGDYDWAHLAMAYWPERVREKCVTDKSIAIAHDLEHLYVEPEPAPKKARGRKKSKGSSE